MNAELPVKHITDYERAVCYYTLPKVVSPLTYGLIIAYGVCVLEAVAALAYGLFTANQAWTVAGACALAGIIVFGMFAFTARALLNDWRRRAALAAARHVPDASDADDIPDPFAGHLLLRRPLHPTSEKYACVTYEGAIEYHIHVRRGNTHWRVTVPQDQPVFDILLEHDTLRASIFHVHAVRLGVYQDKRKIAAIVRRNTFRSVMVDVFSLPPADARHAIIDDCVYISGRLVGRIYVLRGHLYLDVEREHATPGIVAHYVSMK